MRAGQVRAFAVNIAVLAVATLVTVILCELVVRQVMPQALYRFPNGMLASHPKIKFVLASDFEGEANTVEYRTKIRTNAQGFREDRVYGAKPPGTFRVLAIGDSFTMGVGVQSREAFTKVLERRLTANGRAVEVINTGVPGYNNEQQLELLAEIGRELAPDLVLLSLFVGNDIADNTFTGDVVIVDGTMRYAGSEQGMMPASVRYWLQRHSHLFILVRSIWHGSRESAEQRRAAQLRGLSIYEAQPGEAMEKTWGVTEQLLARFAAMDRELGAQTAVVIIPERPQIMAREWQARVDALGLPPGTYERDYPNKRLSRYLDGLAVPVLDLFDTFTTADADTADYFKIDGHWTVAGNERAAERIEAFLRDEGLVP